MQYKTLCAGIVLLYAAIPGLSNTTRNEKSAPATALILRSINNSDRIRSTDRSERHFAHL